MTSSNPLEDSLFLKKVDETRVKEITVKISVLDLQEEPLESIEGRVSQGSVNIEGKSAMRRTASLTFLPDERAYNVEDINNLISINKKIRLELGYKNTFGEYLDYPIIWFPLGVYFIKDVSVARDSQGVAINLQLQDKMCKLDGSLGGKFSSAGVLNEEVYAETVGEEVIYRTRRHTIYTTIKTVVQDIGEEDPGKIIIQDLDLLARTALKWGVAEDSPPVYSYYDPLDNEVKITKNKTTAANSDPNFKEYLRGDSLGYIFSDLYYQDEFKIQAGQTITDFLDQTVATLGGNFEYFYDLDGNFIFREIKNYLNTSFGTTLEKELSYGGDSNLSLTEYEFDHSNLITSYSNSPQFSKIRNDFTVWGVQKNSVTETAAEICYHLVIDDKPLPTKYEGTRLEDWRNVLYRKAASAQLGLDAGYYAKELLAFWPDIYDTTELEWKDKDPESYTRFLDFIGGEGSDIQDMSVSNIGRRPEVITDSKVNCIFKPSLPPWTLIESSDPITRDLQIDEANKKGVEYALLDSDISLDNFAIVAGGFVDAFSRVREMLYTSASYSNSISFQALPIYYLDVNSRVSVRDTKSNINGDYIINSISLPLSISDTMSVQATLAYQRI